MKKIILALLVIGFATPLQAQEDCKVILSQIAGTYEGKCKDGLAHGKGKATGTDTYEGQFVKGLPQGKGTYTWASGDTYTGEWLAGMRQGEGTLRIKGNLKDSIMSGLWENDQYLGPKPSPPKIKQVYNVDRYDFMKNVGIQNRVLVDIYQNGVRNRGIENFMMASSSGMPTNLGESVGYDNIIYPVSIKVTYRTWNKLRTVMFDVIFEFEIFEPGSWVVEIYN